LVQVVQQLCETPSFFGSSMYRSGVELIFSPMR